MKSESRTQYSLETQLVIGCSRTHLNGHHAARIREVLKHPLDWVFILGIASRNGVLPLVCWNLRQNFADVISPETQLLLSELLQKQTQKNLFLTHKLIEICGMLEKHEIPVLPFKGTTLAVQAYGNLALRDYCDLDVLVKPKHFDKAIKILSKNGFEPIGEINWLKRNLLFFNNKKDVGLVGPDKMVHLELHWKLSGSHFALPLEIDDLWKRLDKISLGGKDLYALPFNDLFVYLCLHGSRHAWAKFSWICDLHELIRAQEISSEKIDWARVQSHASTCGCERVVALGLFLVNRFFGLKTSYPDFEKIESNPDYEKIAEKVEQKSFSRSGASIQINDWYLYHLSLKERKTDRLKLHLRYFFWYLKIIFKPNSLDESVFHLPAILYPFYYVLRPIRLLFTYQSGKPSRKTLL